MARPAVGRTSHERGVPAMSPAERHGRYRELLARRLDADLSPAETADLDAHLAACPACRAVAAEYAEQRQLFRALAPDEPPRDLWARTSTALDHEVAHGVRRPSRLAFGVLASLGAIAALVSTQSGLLPGLGQSRTVGATPFAVTPQPVAYITRQGDELTIYQTQVSELCPPPTYDCTSSTADTKTLLRVDTNVDPSDLALGSDGRLVITGRDHEGHAFYSVLELPDASSSAAASGGATPSMPASSPSATPRPTPTSSSRTGSPRPTRPSGATASPDATPAATTDITPPPSPSAAPTPVAGHARAILSNVIAAGAPAAWSPDGSVLAFSAMPADGSHGPDIYTWRPGEPAARPLTKDHRSWFASWVGGRILASHTGRAVGKAGTPLPALETVLLDPATHETRPVDLSGAWLPSVDPTGRYVIYFKGTLERAGAGLRAVDGKLILADWRGLDPYAAGAARERRGDSERQFAGQADGHGRDSGVVGPPDSLAAGHGAGDVQPGRAQRPREWGGLWQRGAVAE